MPVIDTPLGAGFHAVSGSSDDLSPAVLIHGAGGSHLDWPPELRRLPRRRTYAVDLPGHGRSPLPGRQSIDHYADWLAGWAQRLDLPPAVFIGHSMGAAVALALEGCIPDRVVALILIGFGTHVPGLSLVREDLSKAPADVLPHLVDRMYGPSVPPEIRQLGLRRLRQVDARVMAGDLAAIDAFVRCLRLATLPAPALIVAGVEDQMTPAAGAIDLHHCLPGSELVLIEYAGHMMTFEQTAQTMAAIEEFLGRLAA